MSSFVQIEQPRRSLKSVFQKKNKCGKNVQNYNNVSAPSVNRIYLYKALLIVFVPESKMLDEEVCLQLFLEGSDAIK